MKILTIIVPAYNEEKNVRPFYDEVLPFLNSPDYQYQILYINDGSKDNTLSEIKKLAELDPKVRYLSFSRNFGKESAMHAGLEHSKSSDAVIFIDCDLQQPPFLIPEMIKEYENGYKIVYTKGRSRKGEPKLRTVFANLYYKFYNTYSDQPLDNGAKDFQLLDRQVIEAYLSIKDNYRFMKGIFSWVGYKRKCLEYDFIPRKYGKSTWSFKSLFKYGFNGMNQFSNVMMVLPVLSFFTGFIGLAANILLFVFDIFNLSNFLIALEINILWFMISALAYGTFYLIYGLRRQTLNRPIYLIEEASDDGVRP
jgi:glycosyltransferase involved in cell wall biosynthesis